MTTTPVVGFAVRREAFEPAPPSNAQMSVIGLCMPADPAAGVEPEELDDAFPLNQPVLFGSTSPTAAKIDRDCGCGQAISLINAQLARLQSAAQIVLVRVVEGVDDDATIANIVGNASAKTGIHAFTTAAAKIGAIPRLIAAPGYTHQHESEGAGTTVTRAAKAGGNTGGGAMTLADPAFGGSVKAGVYAVRCIGGTLVASVQAAGGNAGDGGLGSLTVDANAKKGAWHVVCIAAAADGGTFSVEDPDGIYFGTATVGAGFSAGTGINFTIADGAADFHVGDSFTVTAVDAVPSNGGVFSVVDPDGVVLANATVGVAYAGAHVRFTIADGGPDFAIGDGFDVTVAVAAGDALANPVVAALPEVLNALLAVAVVDTGGTSRDADVDYRETIQSERIVPVTPGVRMLNSVGATVASFLSPAVLGLFVRRDFENEGRPFRAVMNQPVYGIVGPGRAIDFSLVDGSSEGQDLLSHQVAPLVRGESGDDFAIADGGYVFLGFEGTGEETIWRQIHKVRGRDFIELTAIRTLRQYLGRFTLTTQTIQAIVNTVGGILGIAEARGEILGFQCRFDPLENNASDLRDGKIVIDARFEDVPVFRKATILSRPYSPALEATINDLLAQNGLVPG